VTGSLGKRYARALIGLTRPDGQLEPAGDELARAARTFAEPRLRAVTLSPAIARAARLRIVSNVVATLGVSRWVANLVSLLAERDRLALLPEVAQWYETLVDEEVGRTRVNIRSATPLSAAERGELTELARRLTRRKSVVVNTDVDPELLGGVVLDVAGTVYDGSVRTQLERLSREMVGQRA